MIKFHYTVSLVGSEKNEEILFFDNIAIYIKGKIFFPHINIFDSDEDKEKEARRVLEEEMKPLHFRESVNDLIDSLYQIDDNFSDKNIIEKFLYKKSDKIVGGYINNNFVMSFDTEEFVNLFKEKINKDCFYWNASKAEMTSASIEIVRKPLPNNIENVNDLFRDDFMSDSDSHKLLYNTLHSKPRKIERIIRNGVWVTGEFGQKDI